MSITLRFGTCVSTVLAMLGTASVHAQVVLSEFVADNKATAFDKDGDASDWIEVCNQGSSAASLAGWHLTDDASEPAKWTLPDVVIAPGACILVFASGKDITTGLQLHTNFKLSASGEYLALFPPDGFTPATEYAPAYPPQVEDVSYGISIDGQLQYFAPATPGVPNGTGFIPIDDVDFSHDHGLYSAPLVLSISDSTPETTIRFTLDGSVPDETHGLVYTAPVEIATTTIVRAIAYKGGSSSEVATRTYLFPQHVLQQTDASVVANGYPGEWIDQAGLNWKAWLDGAHPGASYGFDTNVLAPYDQAQLIDWLRAVPTLSLVMPKEDWFGYDPATGRFGIYVNSTEQTDAWDRPCSAEWIDPDGSGFQVNCGVGIQGGSSTSPQNRNQLSMSLKFKSQFGPSKLVFKLFDDSLIDEFDILTVEAGNQRSINASGPLNWKVHAQELMDAFMMRLHAAMGHVTPHVRPMHLYLNGIYWGLYNIHERPDQRFGAAYGGGEPEEYDWIKTGGVFAGNSNPVGASNPGAWKVALDIAAHGVGPEDTWDGQPAYAVLSRYIDYDNYIDYLLLNYYGGNTDWPGKNWMATSHSRVGPDFADVNPDLGFRFHTWDAENVLWWGSQSTVVGDGWYDRTGLESTDPTHAVYLLTHLKKNPEFLLRMADRAHRLLFNGGPLYVEPGYELSGTVYDPEYPERNRPAAIYHDLAAVVAGPMVLEYARFGNYFFAPGTLTPAGWLIERDRLLDEYFAYRSGVLLAQLKGAGMYPNVAAPVHHLVGGLAWAGEALCFTAPSGGAIHYTLDGEDPRAPGGAVLGSAKEYVGPVAIAAPVKVRSRVLSNGTWSALNEQAISVVMDLGGGTPGGAGLAPAGGSLSSGTLGAIAVTGAPPNANGWLAAGYSVNPRQTPFGTLVPQPVLFLPVIMDGNGRLAWTLPDTPDTFVVYAQVVYEDAGGGWAFTNAIEIMISP